MKSVTLEATERKERGKNKAKILRAQGLIPSVVYGHTSNSTAITVELAPLKKILKTDAGRNIIVNLQIKDDSGQVKAIEAMPYQFDFDHIKNELIHVDFIEVSEKIKVNTVVHIEFTGAAPGVKMGGILVHQMDKLHISAVPTKIPGHITVNISGLGLGHVFKVEDVEAIDGVQILDNPKATIVAVEVPRGQKADDSADASATASAGSAAKS